MKKRKPTQSAQWSLINRKHLTSDRLDKWSGFKSSAINYKLSLWNPETNGVRYLKTLIYNLAAHLSPLNWKRLRRIRNRRVGNPIEVVVNGEEICMDYLQAVYELDFILANAPSRIPSILEIGAGYGRTAHAIFCNVEVEHYCIVDLGKCLKLSMKYLKEVLDPVHFGRIEFIAIEDVDRLGRSQFDLCLNIDSFAEMDRDVVKWYLGFIDIHCRWMYVKNPVGKYLDPSLSVSPNARERQLALQAGVLRDIVDIHNNEAVQRQVPKFIRAYRPGKEWKCVADAWACPWSYYWQAFYRKMISEKRTMS